MSSEINKMLAEVIADNARLRRERNEALAEVEKLKEKQAKGTQQTDEPVTKKRKGERFVITYFSAFESIEKVAEKSPAAIKVLLHIMRNASVDGSYSESVASMGASLGIAKSTVQLSISLLEEVDFIKIGKVGRSNVYCLNPQFVSKMSTDQKGRAAYYAVKRAESCDKAVPMQQLIKANTRLDTKGMQALS